MSEALLLQGIGKLVGPPEASLSILHDVNLSVESGDYLAIMGASGSGKSTLLNLIGLLDSASAGVFSFFGRDTSRLADDEAAALRSQFIGFIFQSFNLLPYLTAEQNVALPLSYSRFPEPDVRAKTLLEQVHLSHRLHAYPATLSGGERQRVAIARALANKPSLILADEPTGALDSKTGTQVMEMIGQLHQAGTTIILVTHDEKVARRARRIVHMQDGTII